MVIILSMLIGLSIAAIVLFLWLANAGSGPGESSVRLTTVLFTAWLIAGAVFGPLFFVWRLPGFFDITVERLLFGMLVLALLLGLFTGRVDLRSNISIELWMGLFCLVCIASMMRHGFVSVNPELYPNPWYVFITGYLFPFIVFVFAKNYVIDETDQAVVFHALFYFSLYLVIISFFEFFQMRQFVYPAYINDPGVILHHERARGPFMNAALNGVAIVIGFISGLHLLTIKRGIAKLAHAALLLLYFPAVFFTQTRSVYLAFLIALGGFLFFYRTEIPKWKIMSLPLALVFIFASLQAPRLLSSDRRSGGVLQIEEVVVRLQLIQRSTAILRDHPLFGIGLAQFLPASVEEYKGRGAVAESADEQTQHNHLLGLTVETGIVGIGVYLAIYMLIFRRFLQLRGRIPETEFTGTNLLLTGAIIWAVYLSNNMFVEPSYFIFINSVPFMVGGMADGMYNKYILGTR